MNTKTLKIPTDVHTELKVFIAQHSELNMTDFAGMALLKELHEQGHKFVLPKKGTKSKK